MFCDDLGPEGRLPSFTSPLVGDLMKSCQVAARTNATSGANDGETPFVQFSYCGFSLSSAWTRVLTSWSSCSYASAAMIMWPRSFHPRAGAG
jgi:hypothetical protein